MITGALKGMAYRGIFYSGAWRAVNGLSALLLPGAVRVLYVHRVIDRSHPSFRFLAALGYVTVEGFERRIRHLRKHYRVIPLETLCSFLGQGKLPPRRHAVITFDDGYGCLYRNAFPVLKKYGVPATVFLATSHIGTGGLFWYDKLLFLFERTRMPRVRVPGLSGRDYPLATVEDKRRAYDEIAELLKQADTSRRDRLLRDLFVRLAVREEELEGLEETLSWEQVREMQASGLLTVGAHTVTHPVLTRVPLEEAEREIIASKQEIEKHLQREVRFFAYPNGKKSDSSPALAAAVRRAGFTAACTTLAHDGGPVDMFALPRAGLEEESLHLFGLRMAGFFALAGRLRRKFAPGNGTGKGVTAVGRVFHH